MISWNTKTFCPKHFEYRRIQKYELNITTIKEGRSLISFQIHFIGINKMKFVNDFKQNLITHICQIDASGCSYAVRRDVESRS